MKKYESYKSSGVEWMGEIPQHWTISKVNFCFNIQKGRIPKETEEFSKQDSLPYLSMDVLRGGVAAVFTNDEKVVVGEKDDIAILWDGSNSGEIIKINQKGAISSTVALLNDKHKLLAREYAYYILKHSETDFKNNTVGMGIPHVDGDYLKDSKILLPPLPEQTQIVSYLDRKTALIDSLIDKTERKIELLKEKRIALINQAVTKGLDPNVPMKDSGVEWIGEIPEHWERKKIKHLSKVISKGTTPSTISRELIDEGNIKYLKSENIVNNRVVESPKFFIDSETNNLLKRSILIEGDILFVIAGASIGKVGILPKRFTPSNTNQAVCFIRLKWNESRKFCWYWLTSSFIEKQIWQEAVQSAQPNLSMEDLGNFYIPYPKLNEQLEIVNYLDTETKQINHLIKLEVDRIEKLKEYRQALISEAVTGKIKVTTDD
jgi:type I restriction enzyme S subunit